MNGSRDSQSLSRALAQQSGEWRRWFDHVNEQLPAGPMPTGAVAARLFRNYLEVEPRTPADFIQEVCRRFEIARVPPNWSSPGEGWVDVRRSDGQTQVRMAVGKAGQAKRFSVAAHELGHLIYASLAERSVGIVSDHRVRSTTAERFCWDFALEFCLPRSVRECWNAESANAALSEGERSLVARISDPTARQFTFWHLCAIARRHGVSIRLVISALRKHPVLDKLMIGIAVIRRMLNPATRTDIALRIWQTTFPSWGFVVSRQTAAKQGFLSATSTFDRATNLETKLCLEDLRLKRLSSTGKGRWGAQRLNSLCAYTPVDVEHEGRYLVVVRPWSQFQ